MGLFVVGLVVQAWNLYQTIAHRRLAEIYVSNWYILSAFLWTAVLVIVAYVPWFQGGLPQTVVQGYYMHNGVGMWFTPLALGLTYYALPRFMNRPIYSYSLGVLAFWTQLVFYTLIGGHHFVFSPIPWVLQTVAIVFSVAMLVTVWAGTGNFLLTMRGGWRTVRRSYSLPFLFVGVLGYFLSSTQGTVEAFRSTQAYLHLTNFTVGHSHFTMYAFVAYLVWGVLYGLLPRLTHREPSLVMVGVHFWLSLVGIGIYVGALSIGGYMQGLSWVRGEPFLRSVELMGPFWLWRAVGGLLMFTGHVVFFANLYEMRPPALSPASVPSAAVEAART
jgi:cytochrome c oxidase cbb3-type subunit 1